MYKQSRRLSHFLYVSQNDKKCLICDGDPQTALHLATYLNLPHVVKGLVDKGASLDLQDQDGNTALHVACQHGKTDCATEMTREVSPSKMAPLLETQNWRGEKGTNNYGAGPHQPAMCDVLM